MRTCIARPWGKTGARLGLILVLATGLAGCETMASLDPTGLLADDSVAEPDPNSAAASPDLAGIPAAPQVPDDQRDVANSLAAQANQAQYSADALRAGTEASAPAPGAAAPMSPQVASALAAASAPASDAPPSASDAPPTAAAPSVAPPPAAAAPPSAAPIPVSGNAVATAALPPASAPAPAAASAAVPEAPVRTASAAPVPPPPGAEPAVPAVPPAGAIRSTMMTPPVMSDAALGFKPSTAPALDPSVSNFVTAPILARYRQVTSGAAAAVPGAGGAVIAASPSAMGGIAPTAVVYFPGDGVTLSAAARTQIRRAVAAFKAGGGTGTIRVVGHSSSRTPNMTVERHLQVIFEKSQKRANAVAQELMRQGVPSDRLQIDAVGDSQPVYYESMPKGEDGNRRTEIFVQG
jgi:outer membrane protein OmpA-like peptidoglycan-associated protein